MQILVDKLMKNEVEKLGKLIDNLEKLLVG